MSCCCLVISHHHVHFPTGFETAKALALCGTHVILACRDLNKANKAAAMIRAAQVTFVVILILTQGGSCNSNYWKKQRKCNTILFANSAAGKKKYDQYQIR